MQGNHFDDYMENRYKEEVKWYERAAGRNKRGYWVLRISSIVASVTIPVIIAVGGISATYAAVLGAYVAAA